MPTSHHSTIELITPDELAAVLKVCNKTIYSLVNQRRIRFYKVERGLRFDKNDVMSYLQENRVDSWSKNI